MADDTQKATAAEATEEKAEEKKEAAAEKSADKAEKAAPASKNVQKIVDAVKELSLMEVSELVKALEDEFGVSAAPVAVAGAMPAAGTGAGAAAEEQDEFDIILKDAGSNKIGAIKAVRALKPELGLGDAKTFVESAPKTVLEGVKKEVAEEAKKSLEEAGCVVEMK